MRRRLEDFLARPPSWSIIAEQQWCEHYVDLTQQEEDNWSSWGRAPLARLSLAAMR
jgi:hypothetical protein